MASTETRSQTGVCTNAAGCTRAASGEALPLYPGPGEYCPECGEELSPLAATPSRGATTAAPDTAVKKVDATRGELPAKAAGKPAPQGTFRPVLPPSAVDPPSSGTSPGVWIARAAVLAVFAAAAGITGWRAMNAADAPHPGPGPVQVCRAAVAERLAADMLAAYAAQRHTPAGRFALVPSGSCDVRFSTAAGTPNAVIALDAIVAVVNPLNRVSRLSETDLRAIFSGQVTNWSQLGGMPGAIVPLLPDERSDESHALSSLLLDGVPIAPATQRFGSSADITRAIVGANPRSRNAIGLVAFSDAVPAKVVHLAYLPPPSTLTIRTRRYPYAVAIAVEATPGIKNTDAIGLVQFARSDAGKAVVERDGLVPSEGSH